MRVINWNIERHRPSSWQSRSLVSEIAALKPDLVCLTEAWQNSLDLMDGFSISAPGVAWSPQHADERKVLLWSKVPWEGANAISVLERTGSAVTGLTNLSGLRVRVVGICIPYHFANPLGQSPKAAMWEQHERFLADVKPLIDAWIEDGPTIVLGDFNRRIPRSWGPKKSYELLERAFERLNIVTAGVLSGVKRKTIDHIATAGLSAPSKTCGLPAEDASGATRSDHFGVLVEIPE